ncbi:hypothetical protein H5P36_25100 [Bacillus sp. APMAM]|nr:hypothetical protein [Bacillus sp. APMAM]RTZ53137.1 hypothetical protein EKO25_25035 [Bacillus sp. SAJ1]
MTPYVSTPPSTSHIKWHSYNFTWNYNGKDYDVQELYAQGLDGSSNLATGANGVPLWQNANLLVDGIKTLASIYVQKGIGLIPVVQWSPYELLFSSSTTNVTSNSDIVTYRSLSTVCFAYVKKHGASDTSQSLSFVSNEFSIASTQTLAGYKNGSPYTKSYDSTNFASADNYANAVSEVKGFIDLILRQENRHRFFYRAFAWLPS